ncbi:MAG: carbohydrate-binding protein, partial [Acidobacteriota bacterium]
MKCLTLGLCLGLFLSAGSAGAATLTVNAGGDLQGAIDAAQPGDTILIAAGAVFTGNYRLPAKGGSSYVTIRSAAPDGSLPTAGARIGPTYSALLPKIQSTQNGAAFKTVGAAAYWRLMFLEILPSTTTSSANLVELGGYGAAQSTLASVPHHLVIDRCYIHGTPGYTQRRGISLNSGETQILNSYISEIKDSVNDAQAIAGWNGPGPYLIENNYVEGSGENIMFGGSDPSIPNLVPSNITIRRNDISKPLAWMTQSWVSKNLIELKSADGVLIEGNTIENNWAGAQQGYSILLTPRNQDGTAPSTVVQNVTFQHNIVRHVAAVFNISGYDDNWPSRQTNHIVIRNNLVYDVSTSYVHPGALANGWFAIMGNGPRDITFDHNTIDSSGGDTFLFYEGPTPATTPIYGVTLTNNLLRDNAYGIMGSGTQEGNGSLAAYAPGAIVLRNAIGGADPRFYPVGNDYPPMAQWVAGFVNAAAADYRLASTSLSRGAGTDGTDIGVNFTTLNAAMTGTTVIPPDPPGTPTPFTGTAIALPGTIEVENYDKGGDGIAYHDTTAGNNPGAYRNDDVDIRVTADSSGSYNVKGVRAGEWLAYTVDVAGAGSYAFGFRIASSGTGGTVHLTVDGTDVSGPIALPDTGGWGSWQTATKTGVTLPAGTHVLKFIVDANGSTGSAADINWITVTPTATNPSMAYSGTPVPLPGRVEAENYDKGGEGAGSTLPSVRVPRCW